MNNNFLDFENSVKKYITPENKLYVLQRQNLSCARPIPGYNCPISLTNNGIFDASGFCFDFVDEKADNNNVNNIYAVCPNCFCVKKRYAKLIKQNEDVMETC